MRSLHSSQLPEVTPGSFPSHWLTGFVVDLQDLFDDACKQVRTFPAQVRYHPEPRDFHSQQYFFGEFHDAAYELWGPLRDHFIEGLFEANTPLSRWVTVMQRIDSWVRYMCVVQ